MNNGLKCAQNSLSRQSWNDATTTSRRVMTGAEKRGLIDESMSRRDTNMDCSDLSGALNSMLNCQSVGREDLREDSVIAQ